MDQVFTSVFGEYPSPRFYEIYQKLPKFTLTDHIKELKTYLHEKLRKIDQSTDDGNRPPDGLLGPSTVTFQERADQSLLQISRNKLTIMSQNAVSSIRANCCVYRGKWMYEVQLRSKGVMQIGWCSANCQFTQETGVGDTKLSYGLDGSKKRLWHVNTRVYGPYWRSGDIYGVCLDMDRGTMEYYRNGIGLGVAFTEIERGPGFALFPAVSLAYNESLTANFGGSPFRHPIDGYEPLQRYPDNLLQKSEFLLGHIVTLSRLMSTGKHVKRTDHRSPTPDAIYQLIAGILINELIPFFSKSYVIEDKVFAYIKSMCVIRSDPDLNIVIYPGATQSTLGVFLSLFWTHMNVDQTQLFLKQIVGYLFSMYRETPIDLEYEKQRMVIVILTCICNHMATRKFLLEYKFFKRNFLPIFLYVKPPDESTLGELLPDDHIWTAGLGGQKQKYLDACAKLSTCTDILYTLQKNLVEKLLDNEDGDETTPSSRKIFITKLRKYVMENCLDQRALIFIQGHQQPQTQPAVALSFLCILLDVLKILLIDECTNKKYYVDPVIFYDGTIDYNHFDRVGGVLSHLKNIYHSDLVNMLGVDHPNLLAVGNQQTTARNASQWFASMFQIRVYDTVENFDGTIVGTSFGKPPYVPVEPGNLPICHSINNLLDCCIIYYYAVAHKYIVMIADLRDNIGLLSDILLETTDSFNDIVTTIETLASEVSLPQNQRDLVLKELNERFGERKNVFATRSMQMARKQAWYRSVALGQHRRELLCWMLNSILTTLQESSRHEGLFSFVPEVYLNILPILLDTVLDFSFHDLKKQHEPEDISDSMELIRKSSEFLSLHAADTRVIIASCKDALLQALGSLTCHAIGMQCLEECSSSGQLSLMNTLLRPYENRAWAQSNWLLLRFWLGNGFAYRDSRTPCVWQSGGRPVTLGSQRSRGKNGSNTGLLHHIAPACPSRHFQKLIGEMLTNNEPLSTSLLNSILSQLNWAFSEFILILQEIQNITQRQEQAVVETRHLKICSLCFELTVSLLRTLEMIIDVAPNILKDQARSNSDLLLGRVCQLISQVLSRVTVPPGCFQHVVDMCLPDLSSLTHFNIISAAVGVLLTLLKTEMSSDENMNYIPRLSKSLLTDPSFQIACLEFALGAVKTPILIQDEVPRGNFDPQMRGHIDPLTNEVRVLVAKEIRADPPIIKFSLQDYPTHVNDVEIALVHRMIEVLLLRQTLLSDVTLPSDNSLCPICYSKSISTTFYPCHHQSCDKCILQHLMNSKVCFYCKTFITKVVNSSNAIIFEQVGELPQAASEPIFQTNQFP